MRPVLAAAVFPLLLSVAQAENLATGLDAVTTPGKPATVRAKFTRSGLLRRNLAQEPIRFVVLGETRWVRTDGEGFAATTVTPASVGVFEVQAGLVRDPGAAARARLFVFDPARPVAVVDVDGTLSDMAEWRVPFQGDVASTFPGAPDLLRDLARTHAIVYLTARDDRFAGITKAFLARQGFPDGPVIFDDLGFATSEERAQLNPKNHGTFKLQQIEALRARGVAVQLGLGNAETDAFAYEGAGLKSYILTKKTGSGPSFRFTDYAALRARLELEGVFPPTPKGVSRSGLTGLWKFATERDGAARNGLLEVRRNDGGGLEVTVTEEGGQAWNAPASFLGSVFTVRRSLVPGAVGALGGASGEVIEYVATLHQADEASVAVFRVDGERRVRVGSGTLTRPPYFSESRREIDRAIAAGDDAIIALSDQALAFATPDEKVAMIEVLMNFGKEHFPTVRNLNPIPVRGSRQDAIIRLLATSGDAAAFDRLYYRLNKGRLNRALTGSHEAALKALVEQHHGSAKPGDWAGYLRYLDTATGSSSSGKNQVDFLVDGANVIPVVLSEVDAAKESINLSVFEWEADATGFKFANVLAAKAKAGVKVRVLLDAKGTGKDDKAKELVALMRQAGVEVIVNPASVLSSHLDHRKVLVVDGKVGFTGGMNIGDHYQKEWHDQQTLLKGPVVAKLQDAFLARWTQEGGTPPLPTERLYPPLEESRSGVETRIVTHDGAGMDRNIKAAYLRAIATAQRSIRISSPYFSDYEVVEAVCKAARRGVKVQVVLPRENDMGLLRATARAYYERMIGAGVEVYEYTGRMAHQKVAVIDGLWCTAGSSNLDARSLEFNDELNYVILDPRLAARIEHDLFEVDLARSERMKAPRGTAGPVGAWFLRQVSSWL